MLSYIGSCAIHVYMLLLLLLPSVVSSAESFILSSFIVFLFFQAKPAKKVSFFLYYDFLVRLLIIEYCTGHLKNRNQSFFGCFNYLFQKEL